MRVGGEVEPSARQARSLAAFIAAGAFIFGLGTLWIPDAWPFAVFQGLLCAALLCLLGCALPRPALLSYQPWLSLPFLIALMGALQLAFGLTASRWQTRRAVLEWTTYGVAAFLTYQICLDGRLRRTAVQSLALFSAGLAVLSVVQNYTSPGRVFWMFDSGYEGGVFGPFTYHTKFANFAELGVAAALWCALEVRRGNRLLYLTSAAILVAAVVASASRGGVAIVAAEVAVLLVVSSRGRAGKKLTAKLAFTVGVLVFTAVAILGWEVLVQRLVSSDHARDMRWNIDLSSLTMAHSFGLTGVGLGAWSTVYPQFARFDAYEVINQAHCDWLQWLIEGGIVILAILLAMVTAALRASLQEWWVLGFVFVWLHGLIDYPMQQTPAFAALQIAFWGAALAVPKKDQPAAKSRA